MHPNKKSSAFDDAKDQLACSDATIDRIENAGESLQTKMEGNEKNEGECESEADEARLDCRDCACALGLCAWHSQ